MRLLYVALTALLGEHLSLAPSWPRKERWLDDVRFDSFTSKGPNTIHGRGEAVWGLANDVGGNQWSEPFEATICLLKRGRVNYELIFGEGQFCLRFNNGKA